MPRVGVVIDAPGDKIAVESGFDKKWTGLQLVKGGGGNTPVIDASEGSGDRLINPPASTWLFPRPLQTDPDWYKDTRFASHVLKQGDWVFGGGITPRAWFYHDDITHSYPNDEWLEFVSPDTPSFQPISVNFATLGSTVGVDLSSDNMQVVAATRGAIDPRVTPFFQWTQYPEPDDKMVFGFGDYAFYFDAFHSFLLRSPNNDQQTWELLWGYSKLEASYKGFGWGWLKAGMERLSWSYQTRGAMVVPVGWSDLYIFHGHNTDPWIVSTRTLPADQIRSSGAPAQIKGNKWWIAGGGGRKFAYQVQSVGYNFGHYVAKATTDPHGPTVLDAAGEWFNLGQEYTPTVDPLLFVDGIFQLAVGIDLTNPALASGYDGLDPDSGQEIKLQLVDEQTNVWTSDGTHFRGAATLDITPCTLAAPIGAGMAATVLDCWAPQLREIQIKFPPKIDDRPAINVFLDDGNFKPGWMVTTSLHEPGAKRLTLPLTQTGMQAMLAIGYEALHDYSILLVEESNVTPDVYTDGDGNYLHPRVKVWVAEPPEVIELAQVPRPDSGAKIVLQPSAWDGVTLPSGWHWESVWEMTIHGRGLLHRADRAWEFRAMLVDPFNQGALTHTKAVHDGLMQSGFDSDDADKVFIQDDTAPPERQNLPGHATVNTGEAGVQENEGYAPDWDEHILKWLERVAFGWRKWLFYEDLDGTVLYHADPVDLILDYAILPPVQAVFYLSSARSVAAGQDPRQKYHTQGSIEYQPVRSNKIRCLPALATLPQVICEDLRGQGRTLADGSPGRDTTYENFVGTVVNPQILHPRMAVSVSVMHQIAAVALLRLRRRKRTRVWTCNLAPWEIGWQPSPAGLFLGGTAALDTGVTLGGPDVSENAEVYQIVKIGLEQLGPRIYKSTFTGEALPSPPNLGP